MFALIFGGSGSGKSEYAEKLSCELAQKNEKYYIATMIPYGEEGKKLKGIRSCVKAKIFIQLSRRCIYQGRWKK